MLNLRRDLVRVLLKDRVALVAENLALRQQLAVALRKGRRPTLRRRDRLFWVLLSRRLIGSIRRDCLDHLIVLNERHLRAVLSDYFAYYHASRTHLGLGKDAPNTREVEPPSRGTVVDSPQVGGMHHRYARRAA